MVRKLYEFDATSTSRWRFGDDADRQPLRRLIVAWFQWNRSEATSVSSPTTPAGLRRCHGEDQSDAKQTTGAQAHLWWRTRSGDGRFRRRLALAEAELGDRRSSDPRRASGNRG